jgi:hypothetical protein
MFADRARRILVATVGIVAAGALTGAVVASQFDDGSELRNAIDETPMTRVADIAAQDGSPTLGVFVQRTSSGHVCVWEAPSAASRQRGGGCNTADDPLNGRAISFTLSYDGGPGIERVSAATVFGLAVGEVAQASIVMSDGTARQIRLRPAKIGSDAFQAFGYRFRRADLKKGIGPVAVVAFDANGTEIDRQTTGIG